MDAAMFNSHNMTSATTSAVDQILKARDGSTVPSSIAALA